MLVLLESGLDLPVEGLADRRVSLPFVVVGLTSGTVDPAWLELCDVAVAEDDPALERVEENLAAHPIAAALSRCFCAGLSGAS